MAFATTNNIADRLGRDLTAGEEQSVTFLLDAASAFIAEAASSAEVDIDPVPDVLKYMAVELVCRALANPNSLQSLNETVGSYNYAARFGAAGLALTPAEERLINRAVNGVQSGSVMVGTIFEEDA